MRTGNDTVKWEVGSEFHWMGIANPPFIQWPTPHIMYSTGREALLGIAQALRHEFTNTLFVPDYFCSRTTTWWMQKKIKIKGYIDGPHLAEPDWSTLRVSKHDAVLAVNYFGTRDGLVWSQWHKKNNQALLIEDHSHDPVSGWALRSNADYAFSSLRKTFPVPDGAILWSPKGRPLPNEPERGDWNGSALKLAAMILKKEYLDGQNDGFKNTFRHFQLQGEMLLANSQGSSVSPWSRFLLSGGYPERWRKLRAENVHIFFELIQKSLVAKPLFTKWPGDNCPFNAVLLFQTRADREKYRSRLIEAHIYPAVHWELNPESSADNLHLANRILTIPVDQRYNQADLRRIAKIILTEQ